MLKNSFVMRKFIALFSVALILGACTHNQNPKTIYIVRHAEKQLTGEDPLLSLTGQLRAKKLAQILVDKDIQHVFSTDFVRTRSTAEPIVQAIQLSTELYNPKNQDDLVEILKKRKGNALVIGHSNTVNKLVNYFVSDSLKFDDLTDLEYDFIFEVKLEKNTSTVIRRLYKDFQ